jgi:hypothetical protein
MELNIARYENIFFVFDKLNHEKCVIVASGNIDRERLIDDITGLAFLLSYSSSLKFCYVGSFYSKSQKTFLYINIAFLHSSNKSHSIDIKNNELYKKSLNEISFKRFPSILFFSR